jgi:hypothetical protein
MDYILNILYLGVFGIIDHYTVLHFGHCTVSHSDSRKYILKIACLRQVDSGNFLHTTNNIWTKPSQNPLKRIIYI